MEIIIHQTKITASDTYEYLVVKMDRNFAFSDHLEKALNKSSSRV